MRMSWGYRVGPAMLVLNSSILLLLLLLLLRRGLRVDGNDAVHAKLSQLTLGDICPAFVGRRIGRTGVHHTVKIDSMDVVRGQSFLCTCVGILAHSDDVLHFEESHNVQECLVAQRVQLAENLDWHVTGGHIFTRLRHEGQGTQVMDGTVVKEAFGGRTETTK